MTGGIPGFTSLASFAPRKRWWLVAAVVVGLCFSGCQKQETVRQPLDRDGISGARLWERIAEESPYLTYAYWPGHEGMRPGQSPHGRFHKVYVNRPLLEGLPAVSRQAPVGSIIVKENYSAESVFRNVTVMAKVAGYDPEHGDWFWAAFGADGEVLAEGKPGGCIGCHMGAADNDYVIIRPLDKPIE